MRRYSASSPNFLGGRPGDAGGSERALVHVLAHSLQSFNV